MTWTSFENGLSTPEELTAVTTKKYVVPEVKPVFTKLLVYPRDRRRVVAEEVPLYTLYETRLPDAPWRPSQE